MIATKLNTRVAIQSYTATRDATGGEVETWATVATLWAQVRATGGGERYINQQIVAQVTHTVSLRYTAGITPKMRVLIGSRVLDIQQVQNVDERNIETRLLCKELV